MSSLPSVIALLGSFQTLWKAGVKDVVCLILKEQVLQSILQHITTLGTVNLSDKGLLLLLLCSRRGALPFL